MPVLTTMAETQSVVDHQKRFQAAVDVIHNLPKNGSYRPSYEVMLRFYSLYKQAVCGPCTISRPSFWDPVGRYKWDAWSQLGQMSSESAMAAYVEEMKKVAQEVIDTMPMNEKTASLFHHFEPLYVVINDMPRPPASLLQLEEGCNKDELPTSPDTLQEPEEEAVQEKMVEGQEEESLCDGEPREEPPSVEAPRLQQEEASPPKTLELGIGMVPQDLGRTDGLVLTSDSESEIFCDSVDSVEQLNTIKVEAPKSNGFHTGHVCSESLPIQSSPSGTVPEATKVGAGKGGEGAGADKGPPARRSRDGGRDGMHHGWRERGTAQGSPRQPDQDAQEAGGGAGRRGGDGSEGGPSRLQDAQLQHQIVLALRRLREDMRSVMERLEVVERLAAAQAQSADWRPCLQCAANAPEQEDKWWSFDVSGRTMLLLLLWPLVAQGLVFLLRRSQRKGRASS